MNFEARHIALLDVDGVYRVVCQSPSVASCWVYEDENGDVVVGEECQIALWLNETDPCIRGQIMVPLEIDEWSEDGVIAHFIRDPSLYLGGGRYG